MTQESNGAALEEMDAFFTARLDVYDTHMRTEIEGLQTGYALAAASIPASAAKLLDLGCGTGLELEPVFSILPEIEVTGIDLSGAMLARLREKYPNKRLHLLCDSYVNRDFGKDMYDAAISAETLHHLARTPKTALYRAVYRALKLGGVYVECDYVAPDRETETRLFAEFAALKEAQGLPDDVFYHFDTPFTLENQLAMLEEAGFAKPCVRWQAGNTALIVAEK